MPRKCYFQSINLTFLLFLCLVKSQNDFFIAHQYGNYVCATNSSFALSWIEEEETIPTYQVSSIVPRTEFNPFNGEINDTKSKSHFVKVPWLLKDSTEWSNGEPVLDHRWETIETIVTRPSNIGGYYSRVDKEEFIPVLSTLKTNFDLTFSLRADSEAHIFLCNGENPAQSDCYWLMLQAFSGKRSAIRKCKKFSIPEATGRYPDEPCRNLLVQVDHPQFPAYISTKKWSHLKIKKDGKKLSLHQVDYDTSKKILELEDELDVINVTHMIVHSKKLEAQWKIHNLDFIFADKESSVQLGPVITIPKFRYLDQNSVCLSMFVSMCESCKIKLSLSSEDFIIGENIYTTENSKWKEIKLVVDNIPKDPYRFKLSVSTIGKNSKRFWALDNIRLCQKKEFRIITARTNLTCQLISGEDNIIAINRTATTSESQCPEDAIGPFCLPCDVAFDASCKRSLTGAKVCTKERCFCSAGFDSQSDCHYPCNKGTYGHGCKKSCGKCLRSCDNVVGTCEGCREKYTGPKCDIPLFPKFAEPPKVVDVSFTKAVVQIINFTLESVGKKDRPSTYSLQYKRGENDESWNKIEKDYIFGESQNITIENLKPDTLYFVRSVVTTSDNDYLKTSNFTTKCEEITKTGVDISASNTSAIVSARKVTELSCKLSKYKIFIENVGNPKQLNDTSVEFNRLNPFTEYKVILERDSVKYEQRFQTTEGGPTLIRDWKVTNVTSSTITISWTPPVSSNGLLKHYIVDYQYISNIACRSSTPKATISIKTSKTTISIDNLLPYSKYSFTIRAVNTKFEGLPIQFFPTTSSSFIAPQETPDRVHYIVNGSSVTIGLSDISCDKLRGPLAANLTINCTNSWCTNSNVRKFQQNWPFSPRTFTNLMPFSDYNIDYEFCRQKNCSSFHMTEKFETKPTEPHQVTHLLVFSKNQTSVSLRWKPPYPPTGLLTQYRIAYQEGEQILGIHPCKIWPDLHCATVTNLKEDSRYVFKVSARNEDPPTFSASEVIPTVTGMEKSAAPYDLQTVWSIDNDLELEWKHPNETNGDIRFFKITFNSSMQILMPVNESGYALTYHYKVNSSKILPSTLYTIQISANNGYDGEIATIKETSPPNVPLLRKEPKIVIFENTFLVQVEGDIANRSEQNTYGLLVLISDDVNVPNEKLKFYGKELKLCSPQSRVIYIEDNFNQNASVTIGGNGTGNVSLVSGRSYKVGVIVTNTLDKTSFKVYCFEVYISGFNYAFLGFLLLLLLVPIVIIFLKRHRRKRREEDDTLEYNYPLSNFLEDQKAESRIYENTNPENTPFSKEIYLVNLKDYISRPEISSELAYQHYMIANNRNSVTYLELRDNQYFDYVDIEFFGTQRIPKVYIAADIPKIESVSEFWKTIWDENVLHIVFLTSANNQCLEKFYPKKDERVECSGISAQLAFSKQVDNYELKTFILIKNEEIKHVNLIEFAYQGLNPLQFVPVFKKMSTFPLDPCSPIFIHSKDMERTGFVLLCDMCLRNAQKRNSVDVWKTLKQLSDHRMDLVCNVELYKLAHIVVLKTVFCDKLEEENVENCYENF